MFLINPNFHSTLGNVVPLSYLSVLLTGKKPPHLHSVSPSYLSPTAKTMPFRKKKKAIYCPDKLQLITVLIFKPAVVMIFLASLLSYASLVTSSVTLGTILCLLYAFSSLLHHETYSQKKERPGFYPGRLLSFFF